jgi:hypothetical protein
VEANCSTVQQTPRYRGSDSNASSKKMDVIFGRRRLLLRLERGVDHLSCSESRRRDCSSLAGYGTSLRDLTKLRGLNQHLHRHERRLNDNA